MNFLKPFFEILPEVIVPRQTNLICEVKKHGLSYFFENDETKIIHGLSMFQFEKSNFKNDTATFFKEVFKEYQLLKEEFKKVFLIYAFDESVLVPGKFYNTEMNVEAVELIYGDLEEGIIFTDLVNEMDIHNIYRIPLSVHNTLTTQFPAANFAHQYSLLVKKLPNEINFLQVIIYADKITVLLLKNGKLQIIQSFTYVRHEDVIYHLLNICKQFEIENIPIELNGMIEKDSLLSKEIHKYFLNVTFNDLIKGYKVIERFNEFPPHFFNYLFSMGTCV